MHVFIILRSSCSIYLGMLSLTNMGIAVIFDTCTLPALAYKIVTVHYLQSTQWSLNTVHYLQKYTMVLVHCTLPAEYTMITVHCTLPAEVHNGPCKLYTTCKNTQWSLYTDTTCRSTQWSLYTVHYLQSTQWSLYTVHYLQKYKMVPTFTVHYLQSTQWSLYTTCRSTQWSLYTGTSWFFPWGNCFVHVLIIWLLISF